MPTRNQNSANPNDDTKFTGYELEQQGDLDIYHAEARMYDPVIGRFMSVDPMAHLYPGHTPYHYVLNNPLNFTDPTGMYVVSRAYRTGSGVVSTVTRQNHSFVRTIEGTNSVVGYIPIAGSIVTAQKVMYQRIAGDPSWQPSGWDYASIATLGLSRVTERFVKGARGVSRGISTGGAVSGAMDGFITSDMGRDEVLFDVAAGFGGGNLFRKDGEIGLTLNEGYANALAASVGLDGVDAFTNAFMAVAAGFITGIANQQGFDLTRSEGRQAAYQYYLDNREEYDQMLMDVLGRTNRQR
jgi:RHS repeat-associated protein